MRFEESPATEEEDWCDYRLEWDKHISNFEEKARNGGKSINYGPGYDYYKAFDPAWDSYKDLQRNPWYIGVRLIKIDPESGEEVSKWTK